MKKVTESGLCPIRLVIADDQRLYREGLCDLIAHWPDFEIVGVGANGQEAVELYRQFRPDLLLMDVRMPEKSGVKALSEILTEFPSARVVMMSISSQNPGLFDAIQSGACGFFLKDVTPNQLRHLLHGWAAGKLPRVEDAAIRSKS